MSAPGASRQAPSPWLPALALALLFGWRASELALVVDDAYIGFRYAENLAHHGELVYNLGERVQGYTNPLWTFGLGVAVWLGSDPVVAAVVGGVAAALAALWLSLRCAQRLGAPLWACFMGAALIATNRSFAFWSVAGLESALFGALLLAAWACLDSPSALRPRGALVFALVAALAGLTRAEAALLGLGSTALLAWRGARGRALAMSLVGPAVSLADLLSRYAYYGAWLPNPAVAKVGFSSASTARGASYVLQGLWDDGSLLLVPLIALSLFERRARPLAAGVAAYLAFIVAAGGDGLYAYRFLSHVTPAAGVLVAVGLTVIERRSRRAAFASAALGVVGSLAALTRSDFFRGATLSEVRDWEARFTLVGEALARAAPADALLATNVAGRLPYAARLTTLDLLGLTDAVVARTPVQRMGTGYAGHERAAPAYVLAREPELLYFSVLDGLPDPLFRDPNVLRRVLADGSLRGYAPLLDLPGFTERYRPATVDLADGHRAGVLVSAHVKPGAAMTIRDWAR